MKTITVNENATIKIDRAATGATTLALVRASGPSETRLVAALSSAQVRELVDALTEIALEEPSKPDARGTEIGTSERQRHGRGQVTT